MAREILPLRNEMNEDRARLHTLMTAEDPDIQSVNSRVDEMSTLRARIMKISMDNRQEVRKVLTEEQRIIFDSRFNGRKSMGRWSRGLNCNYPNRQGPYQCRGFGRFQRRSPSN